MNFESIEKLPAVRVSEPEPVPGNLRIGPVKAMTLAAMRGCLARHGLSTGNDAALVLVLDDAAALWLQVQGMDVTGYLLEAGSFGFEACEEAVDAFLREVSVPGKMIRMNGEYSPESHVIVRSTENHLCGAQGLSSQRQRVSHGPAGRVLLMAEGGPLLVASQQGQTLTQAETAKSA